jgi:hypothetical protein
VQEDDIRRQLDEQLLAFVVGVSRLPGDDVVDLLDGPTAVPFIVFGKRAPETVAGPLESLPT